MRSGIIIDVTAADRDLCSAVPTATAFSILVRSRLGLMGAASLPTRSITGKLTDAYWCCYPLSALRH